MVNYACGFNPSETGKYFELIIINFISLLWTVSLVTYARLSQSITIDIFSVSSIVIDYRYQSIAIGDWYRLISSVSIDFRYRFLSIDYAWVNARDKNMFCRAIKLQCFDGQLAKVNLLHWTFLACTFCFPNSDHLTLSRKFSFCLFTNHAHVRTCITRYFKETIL